jgi:hypothetical protein
VSNVLNLKKNLFLLVGGVWTAGVYTSCHGSPGVNVVSIFLSLKPRQNKLECLADNKFF